MRRMLLVIVSIFLAGSQCQAVQQIQTKEGAEVNELTLAELREQRKEMAWRKRRIIFNNDGDDQSSQEATTAEGLLKQRTTALLGSQVDAIWYYSTYGMKLHHQDGPFGKLYACGDRNGIATANYELLMKEEGKDALEIMIDVCRKHDLECFYANRVNDVHDSFFEGIMYRLREEHPEWMLSTKEEGKKYQYPDLRSCWTAWNFEVDEIRELTVEAMREVFQTYDVDGIEMDFWRHTIYFPEAMESKPVTPEHTELMNEMMRQLRRAADEEGLKRGRPILIAGRCVEDVQISRNSGLDVKTWLEEGLVDMLSVAHGTEHTAPMTDLIDLAHRYDTPIYPISGATHKSAWEQEYDPNDELAHYRAMLGNLPVWRGDVLCHLANGADGVQLFNIFDPTIRQWWELGEPAEMLKMDRTYVWDYLPSQRAGNDTFAQLRMTRHRWPVTVTAEGCEAMPLFVGEDLSAPAPAGKQRELTLRVHVTGLTTTHQLTVQVNGQTLPVPQISPALSDQPQDVWLEYDVTGDLFQPGENDVDARINGEEAPPGTVAIDQIRLNVDHQAD